jgi:DNA (cytosine-5)-methyltransferase 1
VFGAVTPREKEVLTALVKLRRRDRRRSYGDADPVLPATIIRHLGRRCTRDINNLVGLGYLRWIDKYVDLQHTYNGKFRRLSLNGASPTVDTHFGEPSLFLHPQQNRGLTPREAARIQGFPDTFQLNCSRPKSFKMIGNAVPPPMARRIARFIKNAFFE